MAATRCVIHHNGLVQDCWGNFDLVFLDITLKPQQSLKAFVLTHSAINPQAFQTQLPNTQRKLLQQRTMQALVAPADLMRGMQTEIRTETTSAKQVDLATVTLQLSAEFQDVLAVSCQPKQVWASPAKGSPRIGF